MVISFKKLEDILYFGSNQNTFFVFSDNSRTIFIGIGSYLTNFRKIVTTKRRELLKTSVWVTKTVLQNCTAQFYFIRCCTNHKSIFFFRLSSFIWGGVVSYCDGQTVEIIIYKIIIYIIYIILSYIRLSYISCVFSERRNHSGIMIKM